MENEIKMYQPDINLKGIFQIAKNLYIGKNQEEKINLFKVKIANKLKLDVNRCILTKNATNALFVLFKTLNIKGEVIVPTISYVGISNAIKNSGAKVKLCDIEEDLNPSLYQIKKVYNKNCKALVINNYGGYQIEELYKIKNFCKEKNMFLIEDRASNLLGGSGNHYADFVIYSFNYTKIITTIEGGMIYINNHKHLKYLENMTSSEEKNNLNYLGVEIGITQLERLDELVEKKLKNEKLYFNLLQNNFYVPKINEQIKGWYWIRTNEEKKKKILEKLKENKIESIFYYYPIHLRNSHENENKIILHKSEEMNKQIVCLPLHTKLKKQEIEKICLLLNKTK